jgi:glycerophosphoryl diester phosphodiesterase
MGAQEPLSPVFMIPEFYQGMPVLSPELITTLHQHGKKVWVWTVNEPGDFLRLKQEGVDGVFTKFPEHMATQLEF